MAVGMNSGERNPIKQNNQMNRSTNKNDPTKGKDKVMSQVVALGRRLSLALQKNRFTPGDRAGIHTSCRSESSNNKLGRFRQHNMPP